MLFLLLRVVWQQWGNWSQCSATCGRGSRTRTRLCLNGSVGDAGCMGSTSETIDCDGGDCTGETEYSRLNANFVTFLQPPTKLVTNVVSSFYLLYFMAIIEHIKFLNLHFKLFRKKQTLEKRFKID